MYTYHTVGHTLLVPSCMQPLKERTQQPLHQKFSHCPVSRLQLKTIAISSYHSTSGPVPHAQRPRPLPPEPSRLAKSHKKSVLLRKMVDNDQLEEEAGDSGRSERCNRLQFDINLRLDSPSSQFSIHSCKHRTSSSSLHSPSPPPSSSPSLPTPLSHSSSSSHSDTATDQRDMSPTPHHSGTSSPDLDHPLPTNEDTLPASEEIDCPLPTSDIAGSEEALARSTCEVMEDAPCSVPSSNTATPEVAVSWLPVVPQPVSNTQYAVWDVAG